MEGRLCPLSSRFFRPIVTGWADRVSNWLIPSPKVVPFLLKAARSGAKKRKVNEKTSGDEELGIPRSRVTHISKKFDCVFY